MSRYVRPARRKLDRRVCRTRERLGNALVELVQEKPFDAITVQDVLDRADVGRSTFYAHYRDKNDLFISDADDFFDGMATLLLRRSEASDRVAPVRELFAHLSDVRRFHAALVASGRIHDLLELGRQHFARAIDRRLAALPRARGIAATRRAPLAQMLAGAMLSLLEWWIGQPEPGSPEEMDALFHEMAWHGIAAAPRSGRKSDRCPPI